MQYRITQEEAHRAKIPHHIFNFNILITHLFAAYTILEIGHGAMLPFLIIPAVSTAVILYLCSRVKVKLQNDTWFVAANWLVACRRGKILIGAYIAAITLMAVYMLIDMIFPGGMKMNDFSADGSSTNLMQVIFMYFSAFIVFVAVLFTFIQTGISVFEAGQGILDDKIEMLLPRKEGDNESLGHAEEESVPDEVRQHHH